MRIGLLLLLASTAACNTDALGPNDDGQPAPTSVRERLDDRTRLLVSNDASTGSVTAEKKNGAEWDVGMIDLPFENGEIEMSSDANDALTIESMQIHFADIPLPESLFGGREATLTGLRIELEDSVRASATWANDDDVALVTELPLQLHWSITLNGSATELGSPHLPKVGVGIRLVGDADHVNASLSAYAPGELWSWAGVIKLSELQLDVDANLAPAL
jgi:hypothetical protein